MRRDLIDRDWIEVSFTSEHGVVAAELPLIHRDPFDRALVAQASVEGKQLITADEQVAKYPGAIRKV